MKLNERKFIWKTFSIQKLIIVLIIIISLLNNKNPYDYKLELNKNYIKIQLDLNLTFNNKLKDKIKLAIYYTSIKNGGIERLTSLLLNYLDKAKIFDTYLLTQKPKDENEYQMPMNTKRIIIFLFPCRLNDIIVKIEEKLYIEYPQYKDYN